MFSAVRPGPERWLIAQARHDANGETSSSVNLDYLEWHAPAPHIYSVNLLRGKIYLRSRKPENKWIVTSQLLLAKTSLCHAFSASMFLWFQFYRRCGRKQDARNWGSRLSRYVARQLRLARSRAQSATRCHIEAINCYMNDTTLKPNLR
jgi:hypothetical protein